MGAGVSCKERWLVSGVQDLMAAMQVQKHQTRSSIRKAQG